MVKLLFSFYSFKSFNAEQPLWFISIFQAPGQPQIEDLFQALRDGRNLLLLLRVLTGRLLVSMTEYLIFDLFFSKWMFYLNEKLRIVGYKLTIWKFSEEHVFIFGSNVDWISGFQDFHVVLQL